MKRTKWVLDPSHSEIRFKVKHLMITTVTGQFNEFSAEAVSDDDDFENTQVTFRARSGSVDTNSEQRDTHLRSADFFDAEKYPEITFVSSSFKKSGNDMFTLTGDLTIRDITQPVTLEVELGGIGKDPYGNIKAGFTLNGKLHRKNWNLNWNATLETGGMLVSDEVRITADVQFMKQQEN